MLGPMVVSTQLVERRRHYKSLARQCLLSLRLLGRNRKPQFRRRPKPIQRSWNRISNVCSTFETGIRTEYSSLDLSCSSFNILHSLRFVRLLCFFFQYGFHMFLVILESHDLPFFTRMALRAFLAVIGISRPVTGAIMTRTWPEPTLWVDGDFGCFRSMIGRRYDINWMFRPVGGLDEGFGHLASVHRYLSRDSRYSFKAGSFSVKSCSPCPWSQACSLLTRSHHSTHLKIIKIIGHNAHLCPLRQRSIYV
jgi:hypothetical protein